jgi:hypothetical protein
MICYFFLAAGFIIGAAFFIHLIGGNKEYLKIKPSRDDESFQYWLLGSCCFQMVSADLLITAAFMLLMGLDIIPYNYHLALFLTVIFAGYLIFWLLNLSLNRAKPRYYLRLGQWTLFVSAMLLMIVGIITQ